MAYSPSYDAVKIEKLAKTSWELLGRAIVLPRLIQTRNGDEFIGTKGDAVSIKVPGRLKARRRDLRPVDEASRTLQLDTLAESKFQIQIDQNIYSATPMEDEVLKMDIEDAVRQVLAPQIRAVAIDYENLIADEITGADYLAENVIAFDADNPYESIVRAAHQLNKAYVPRDGRTLIVGSGVALAIRLSKQLIVASSSGDAIAGNMLRTATMGQLAGVNIVEVDVLPEGEAYMFHRSAFAASTISPVIPDGASYGKQISGGDAPSLTWIKDYDFLVSRDRSLVHFYAGVNTFKDLADSNADNDLVAGGGLLRAVKLTLSLT